MQQRAKRTQLSIKEILRILSGKGRTLLLILLSLPFCQPIQIPGLSTPFGLIIAFFGIRMTFGKRIWLPRKLLAKKISPSTLKKITNKTLLLIRKLRPFIRPRFTWACHSRIMSRGNGLIFFILGVFLALPLPIPFSNLSAAWSIVLIALGVLEDDGIFILIGYLIILFTLAFILLMFLTLKNVF